MGVEVVSPDESALGVEVVSPDELVLGVEAVLPDEFVLSVELEVAAELSVFSESFTLNCSAEFNLLTGTIGESSLKESPVLGLEEP